MNDRITALEGALRSIVDSYEASSELHTSSADCAANMYDRARAALAASRAAPDCHQPDLVTAAQVRIKPLEWEPIGKLFHAFDDLFMVMAISESPADYDAKRSARILAALDLTPAPEVEPRTVIGCDASVAVCPIRDIAGCQHLRGEAPAVEPVAQALHRSFPEAGDGRPMPPMGDDLMTAGLSAEDARFVAVQLAQNGLTLMQAVEPVTWRWRPKGSSVWIYDPKPEWLEMQPSDEIDAEPLYASQPTPTAQDAARVPEIAALIEEAWCAGRDAAASAAFHARPLQISQLEAIGALTPPAALRAIGGDA